MCMSLCDAWQCRGVTRQRRGEEGAGGEGANEGTPVSRGGCSANLPAQNRHPQAKAKERRTSVALRLGKFLFQLTLTGSPRSSVRQHHHKQIYQQQHPSPCLLWNSRWTPSLLTLPNQVESQSDVMSKVPRDRRCSRKLWSPDHGLG